MGIRRTINPVSRLWSQDPHLRRRTVELPFGRTAESKSVRLFNDFNAHLEKSAERRSSDLNGLAAVFQMKAVDRPRFGGRFVFGMSDEVSGGRRDRVPCPDWKLPTR
jgi:hypothetical protein